MPGTGFELYGNVGELQNLAGVQHTYRGRFEAILGQIQSAVGTVTPKWVGAGTAGFQSFNTSTEAEFTDVQAAFNKLATATEDAGTNWNGAISRIDARWGS
jgi:uncharacterized protein YukE